MNLEFNRELIKSYSSNAQIVRIASEAWVKENSYCPSCGNNNINDYPNNKPVADFYCISCKEDYELKSKNGNLGTKIVDGAYSTMIERISSLSNPNFFFLTYDKKKWIVNNFIIIPKQFFIPDIIEKRKPLSANARRAGWVGCNIDLSEIPSLGQIFLIKNSIVVKKKDVIESFNKTSSFKDKNIEKKGWIIDILRCIDRVKSQNFTLNDIYKFEDELKLKHPKNNFIKDKIRQQLQYLRDLNIIEFTNRGNYKKH